MSNRDTILTKVTQHLAQAGYQLDDLQPHTLGERAVMQNITTTSGQKLILLGQNQAHEKVVIKVALDDVGAQELQHERACRALVTEIDFSYQQFFTPNELDFWTEGTYTISVQEFIDQATTFIERPTLEQFTFALDAFKTQASARATTQSHFKTIADTFGVRTSTTYQSLIDTFTATIVQHTTDTTLQTTINEAVSTIKSNSERIEQYCGFLTHTDFVPHNFRISCDRLYLLDCASLEFGNKHESWGRFLNFMTLYNHELEELLVTYVEKNYSPEERESLQLMRIYRLVEIVTYYLSRLPISTDNLLKLNQARVQFWHQVLRAELQNQRVDRAIVHEYCITRDQLRSEEEKVRQRGLH